MTTKKTAFAKSIVTQLENDAIFAIGAGDKLLFGTDWPILSVPRYQKILARTKEQLLSQEGLMFDGDPASPEAIDSILSAMQIGMELAKKKNKEKYTPKKYKKD